MGEIEGNDHVTYKPYENSGIEEGDRIIAINENTVTCTADLINEVNASGGKEVIVQYIKGEDTLQTTMIPAKGSDNHYKLGLWVRDAAAGVGTVSFYEPETKTFAALGHGIQDVDTGNLIEIAKGDFITFIDADDWVDIDYIDKMYHCIKKHDTDIAVASVIRIKASGKFRRYSNYTEEIFYTGFNNLAKTLKIPSHWQVWGILWLRGIPQVPVYQKYLSLAFFLPGGHALKAVYHLFDQ